MKITCAILLQEIYIYTCIILKEICKTVSQLYSLHDLILNASLIQFSQHLCCVSIYSLYNSKNYHPALPPSSHGVYIASGDLDLF